MEYYKELRKYVGHRPLILPGSVVIIVNENGEILLQERKEGAWGLPGGLMDLGESFVDTAKREVLEETGLHIDNLLLLEVFSGSECYYKNPNGDELYSITAVYKTTDFKGVLRPDLDESKSLSFYKLDSIPDNMELEYKNCIKAYIRSLYE